MNNGINVIESINEDVVLIKELLLSYHLPVEDINESNISFYLIKKKGQVQACAGLEPFDDVGLLRSVAVHNKWRGRGLGKEIVKQVLEQARSIGITHLYLLTETAESFFSKLGFLKIPREKAPKSIKASNEFTDLCPVSAVLMTKKI